MVSRVHSSPSFEQSLARLLTMKPNSIQRQRGLDRLMQAMVASGAILTCRDCDPEAYDLALQQAWLHFCREPEAYLRGGVMHNFNRRLVMALQAA
jgi:hypothetical protein